MEISSIILLSIKPQFVELIANKEKNYEFRRYKPSRDVSTIVVYTSSPVKEIRYILDIDDIVEYPQQIDESGIGNSDFNEGKKKSRYAYRIKAVYELEKSVSLSVLKDKFGFYPPQRYIYGNSITELIEFIFKIEKKENCMMNTQEIQKEVIRNKIEKGFNTTNIEKEFCLLYGEVGEAYEAFRKKKSDLDLELADVAIYLFGISEILGIDLEEAINKKLQINRKRVYQKIDGVNHKTDENQ